MKMEFAKLKSEYSVLMWKNIEELELSITDRRNNLERIQEIEKEIRKHGDRILTIVTTDKTNPARDKCADPMSEKDFSK